jgi:hypothetical protein
MKASRLALDRTLAAPYGKCCPAFPAVDYSADMLRCTMPCDPCPDRFGYLLGERIARSVRNQCMASVLSRARNVMAKVRARRPQVATGDA